MGCWVAYEHVAGWPTDAYVVVWADAREHAERMMEFAIAQEEGKATLDRRQRQRLQAIVRGEMREISADDPRAAQVNESHKWAFHGFD